MSDFFKKFTLWPLLGMCCLIMAGLGIVLPVLPTTPFVLLAAWSFAKSSPRLHQWLVESQLFGPTLRNWEANRCISRQTRRASLLMMFAVGVTSVCFFVPEGWPKIASLFFIGLGCVTVLSLDVCAESDNCDL